MDIEQILTPGLGNTTYLLASDGETVVVDPPRDAWRVTAVADARGWRLTHVVETHVHNDYLSGALELRADRRAEIVAPARGRYAFEHRGVDEGDTVEVGGLRLVARATPGHTPEHLAWEVLAEGATAPSAVLTGGSLLVGSAGRTDLLGADATERLTHAQFDSLRALAGLPDDVAVLPTHGAGSFCTAGPVDGARTSTIGIERRMNPLLAARDEATFRAALLGGLGAYPTYYGEMAAINRAGPVVLGRPAVPPALDAAAFRAAVAAGAHVVDARPRAEFAAGHLLGSLSIELDDSFASYVGWFVPFGSAVALVLPEPLEAALEAASVQLFRIGYDRVVGALSGGVAAWADAGGALAAFPTTTIGALHEQAIAGGPGYALDVRDPHEWREDGVVPGAIRVPLGELADQLASIPRDGVVTVFCRTGRRAGIAASLLEAAGVDVRLIAQGGAADWPAASPGPNLPAASPEAAASTATPTDPPRR
jgi:glyoxylase-like metal-dependent hydrolase (beta-lactamase superfamily II)/rhodanese-related sulfurtransferase